MRKIHLFALVLATLPVLLFVLFPVGSVAAVDQAARLEAIFERHIAARKAAARAQGGELRTEGRIMVERADGYYAVTLPHMALHRADGSYTELGIVSINATPGTDAKSWKMSVAAPTPIIAYGADKQPTLRIDLGGQSMAGLWHEDIDGFQKLDGRYRNIKILQHGTQTTLNVPELHILHDLEPGKKGWSGRVSYSAESLDIQRDNDPGTSKIGRVRLDSTIRDFNPDALRDYQEKMAAVIESQRNATAPHTISKQHTLGLYNMLSNFLGGAMDGFGGRLEIEDVTLHRPAIPGSPEGTLTFKKASIGMAGDGFHGDHVQMRLNLDYDGFTLTPPPPGAQDTLPDTLKIDITIDKIPFRDMLALGQTALKGADDTQAAMQGLLHRAGTTVKVSDSRAANPLYALMLDGHAVASATSPHGATVNATIRISGMEKLIERTQGKILDKSTDAETRKKLAGHALMLGTVQLLGQQEKSPDGTSLRVYAVQITEDGKIMLNGNDLSAIQAMMNMGRQ